MSELELRAARPLRRGAARVRAAEVLALVFVALLLFAAVAPGLLAPADPLAVAPRDAFAPPSAAHLLGTDESGRDVLSRLISGAGASLLIGVSATAIGLVLGALLGVIAAFGGRAVDAVIGRVLEVLFAFPALLLALLVIVVTGPGVVPATIAVGLSTAPGYARILRTQLLGIRDSGYVEAARVLGHPPARILLRHVLPNTFGPLAVLATLGIGQAIVWASALSYLGLGAEPPAPEWGAMLSAGRTYLASAWWLTVFPGLAIVLTTIATTVLGGRLRGAR
ncbi:ABC transporter permease [Rathayibacter iranicus]|uniref:Peptide/nickel transport system permease protein n=1 Tax=Rathayibacter iranicus NCPPB 2253 = VKM Ac-1602 TaxID=1328868 RepID=A0ABX5LIX2_9MICO|nr:ABC transporter permease subunit [Rathayibacter iranicus NCPPB 2253 = VKM Ac-1602]PPI42430.1 peptide ABC transporter permease [Rathayibacter iranicus]PPI57852.1 peptide ABC transporter permease [Rathayibacter iranicus]PPI68790.1 peptide ABC transporter permease [Rathayibacter iranicus]PWJ66596.1 peptide/nickel transport system permease protein [Rathayibacter iranicus NCPPB 2253 = VKM Ac-1602]